MASKYLQWNKYRLIVEEKSCFTVRNELYLPYILMLETEAYSIEVERKMKKR
jgi:hypothetical protein